MFDFHAHLGEDNSNAFVSILEEKELIKIPEFASLGYLPWHENIKLSKIELLIHDNPSLMVGEIGLDKTKGVIENDLRYFRSMLSIAKEYERTVVIHSVRANDIILKELKDFKIEKAIFHSFTSSYEEARKIEKRGYLISLGPRSFKTRDIDRLLELNFLLESDMRCSLEQKKVLKALYEEAKKRTGKDIEKQMEDNWRNIWQKSF